MMFTDEVVEDAMATLGKLGFTAQEAAEALRTLVLMWEEPRDDAGEF